MSTDPGDVDAGRLYLDVVADTSGLKRDLQTKLDAIARTARLQIQADIVVNAAKARAEIDRATRGAKVRLDVEADTTAARAEIDKTAADRTVKLKTTADTTAAKAQLDAAARDRTVKLKADPDTSLAQKIEDIGGKAESVAMSIGKWGAAMPLAVGAAGNLAGALVAVVAAASQAAGVIGALPGLLVAAGQGAGTLLLGFSGVTGAVKAMDTAQQNAGKTAIQMAQEQQAAADRVRQAQQGLVSAQQNASDSIRAAEHNLQQSILARYNTQYQAAQSMQAAEHSLAEAQFSEQQAQVALTNARRDAAEQLVQLRFAARGAALDESQAQINLEQAQIRLQQIMQSAAATPLQRQQALLDVKQAQLALDEAQHKVKTTADEQARADKAGVEGSQQVVQAKHSEANAIYDVHQQEAAIARLRITSAQSLAEANYNIQTAEIGLDRARQNAAVSLLNAQIALREALQAQHTQMTTANADVTALNRAMAQLSPAGRRFADFIHNTLEPRFRSLRSAVQEALLPPLQQGVARALPILDTIQQGLIGTARVIGDFAGKFGSFLGSPGVRADLAGVMATNNQAMGYGADAALHLADALRNVTVAAEPLTLAIAKGTDRLAEWLDRASQSGRASGHLAEFFAQAWKSADTLLHILGNLGRTLADVLHAAAPSGQTILDKLAAATDKLHQWTSSPDGQAAMQRFFENSIPILEKVGSLLVKIGEILIKLTAATGGGTFNLMLSSLNLLADVLLKIEDIPGLGQVLQVILAMSLLGVGLGKVASNIGAIGTGLRNLTKIPGLGLLVGKLLELTGLQGVLDKLTKKTPGKAGETSLESSAATAADTLTTGATKAGDALIAAAEKAAGLIAEACAGCAEKMTANAAVAADELTAGGARAGAEMAAGGARAGAEEAAGGAAGAAAGGAGWLSRAGRYGGRALGILGGGLLAGQALGMFAPQSGQAGLRQYRRQVPGWLQGISGFAFGGSQQAANVFHMLPDRSDVSQWWSDVAGGGGGGSRVAPGGRAEIGTGRQAGAIPEAWSQAYEHFQRDFAGKITDWFTRSLPHAITQTIPHWFDSGYQAFMGDFGSPVARFITQSVPRFFTSTIPHWLDSGYQAFMGDFGSPIARFITQTIPNFFTQTIPHWLDRFGANLQHDAVAPVYNFVTRSIPNWFTSTVPHYFDRFWNTLNGKVITPVYNFITRSIPNWFGNTIPHWFDSVGGWFSNKVAGPVGNWFTKSLPNTIEGAFKGAVNWVIKNVINRVIGWIDDATQIVGVHIAKVSTLATGGVVPGEGRGDKIPALLEPKERVLSLAQVSAFGGGSLNAGHAVLDALVGRTTGAPRPGRFATGGIPGGGIISHVISSAENIIKGGASGLADLLGLAKSAGIRVAVNTAWKYLVSPLLKTAGISGNLDKLVPHEIAYILDTIKQGVQGLGAGGGRGYGSPVSVSGNVVQWLTKALQLTGTPMSWLPGMEIIVRYESGGNPNAINLSDCVTLDYVILTRRGWLRHDQVRTGDETLGYNQDTGRAEWTRITRVVHYENAEVWRIGHKRWRADVTPNHRWWSDTITTGKPQYRVSRGEFVRTDAFKSGHRLRLAAPADTDGLPGLSLEEVRIIAWLQGDGTLSPVKAKPVVCPECGWIPGDYRERRGTQPGNAVAVHRAKKHDMTKGKTRGELAGWDGRIWQSKPEQIVKIRALLAGVPHGESVRVRAGPHGDHLPSHAFTLHRAYVTDLIKRSGLMETGPEAFVLALSPDQRAAWLDSMIDAEGHRQAGKRAGHNTFVRIAQVNGPLQDAIKLAVYLEGYRPTYSKANNEQRGFKPAGWIGMAQPHVAPSTFFPHQVLDRQPVWCVTTELGTWTTRGGDDLPFLTGNSNAAAGDPSRGLLSSARRSCRRSWPTISPEPASTSTTR